MSAHLRAADLEQHARLGVQPLTAAEIPWTLAPAPPWPSSRPVLALAIELLPTIDDDLVADLVEQLTVALIDRAEELRAVRAVRCEALALAHSHHREIARLKKRLADLRDAQRLERRPAA